MVKVIGPTGAAYIIAHRPELLTQYPDLAKAHPELFAPILLPTGVTTHSAVGTTVFHGLQTLVPSGIATHSAIGTPVIS